MKNQRPPILDNEQFQSAVDGALVRFCQIEEKYPAFKGYLVLAIPGKQTGIGSSPTEILSNLPAMIIDDGAKAAFTAFLRKPLPNDASESQKRQAEEEFKRLSRNLKYDGSVCVEIRFRHLDYELIPKLQRDELVDRDLTPQTPASILIVLGRLDEFRAGGASL